MVDGATPQLVQEVGDKGIVGAEHLEPGTVPAVPRARSSLQGRDGNVPIAEEAYAEAHHGPLPVGATARFW